uniref:Uncharacterized protein n=1 Tax=Rhizophora mucronata TaxID=61149 RepID=A0A2P2Q815_RHIMU
MPLKLLCAEKVSLPKEPSIESELERGPDAEKFIS